MKISVIIPTLNEEACLPSLLSALGGDEFVAEVIICDGGSVDATRALARDAGAHVIETDLGRGQQLCAGAAKASGDVLWFLHADTVSGAGAPKAILHSLEQSPRSPGGNFRVVFDGDSEFSEWLTGFYAWLRSMGVYYGDSAVFVRRKAYEEMGGLLATALMEDYEFTRRLERAGPTLHIDHPAVTTSSRRFTDRAPWRIVSQWIFIHALYYCCVPGNWLSRVYHSHQHSPADQK
ncbi:MAG: glycosyltransferase family 2 protein [Pseudomonadota bacterium]